MSGEVPRRARPSLGAAFSNWRGSDAPPLVKLRMAVANNLAKLRSRRNCCGNHGQPGCGIAAPGVR